MQKVIRTIPTQTGTISDDNGPKFPVRFSLTEWQEFVNGELPSVTSARGHIEFEDTAKAFFFMNSLGPHTLRGGGIEVSIIMDRLTEFKVTGPIKDLK